MLTLFIGLGRHAETAIKAAMARYKETKGDVPIEVLAGVCLKAVKEWDPEVRGRKVLTPSVRASLSRGLAALAYNIAAADAGREPL